MLGFYKAAADRLADRARCPSLLQVASGMDAQAVAEIIALGADVTAIVTPLSDDAVPVGQAGFKISQPENWTFGVHMALVFPGGFPQWEIARAEIKGALRGWLPEGAATPIQYAGGRTTLFEAQKAGGRWMYLMRFRLSVQETYEVQS